MGDRGVRIAIVGAGAAGTVAAYRLWQRFGDEADITVYERGEHVGGRAWDIHFAGTRIEIGGTLLHSSGKYTMELMRLTDSTEGTSGLSLDGKDETYAFWTDKGFPVFTHTSLPSMAAGILKYVGIGSAGKVVRSATAMASKWERIYELIGDGQVFDSPQTMLKALDLYEPTLISVKDHFDKLKVNKRMTHHIVEAIIHNMYNQGVEIGTLAGLVGLAGAGLAGGYLFAIEGGNWTLYDKTLRKINANLRVNTQVVRIERQSAGAGAGSGAGAGAEGRPSFVVTAIDGDATNTSTTATADATNTATADATATAANTATAIAATNTSTTATAESYDAVVIAAPFALADLEVSLDGAPLNAAVYPYQEVQTTLVVGSLDPKYFGVSSNEKLPSTVFTSDSANAPFKSIGVTGYSPTYESRIYKIFSADHEMTEDELGEIFAKIHDVCRFVWRGAYPILTPGIAHLPFELAPGLFYACAFETAAGAIEVESVGGWNTAELAARYLGTVKE